MLNSEKPSNLEISGFLFVNSTITKQTNINTAQSIKRYVPSRLIGLIKAETPKTQSVLNMLLPIKLPIAMFILFFFKAAYEVLSSGRDVPTAIIIMEIKV